MEPNQPKEDAIAAKREARRRKVLENAKERMSRITGREHNTDDDKPTNSTNDALPREQIIYPDPEIERDVFVSDRVQFQSAMFGAPEMGPFENQQSLIDLLNSIRQEQESGQSNANMNNFGAFAQFGNLDGAAGANPLFANIQQDDIQKVPETRLQKYLKKKFHIAILSIITYLLITMASFHCNVFLIFLIWEITEIFLLRQHENNSNGIINVLFLLAGITPTKINILLKWIQLLNKIFYDVAIFIFFFVLIHVGYMSWMGLSLIPTSRGSPVVDKILEMPNVYDNADEDVFEHFDL